MTCFVIIGIAYILRNGWKPTQNWELWVQNIILIYASYKFISFENNTYLNLLYKDVV